MKVKSKSRRNVPLVIKIENDFPPDIDPREGHWTFDISLENLDRVESQLPDMDEATAKITCSLLIMGLRYFLEGA